MESSIIENISFRISVVEKTLTHPEVLKKWINGKLTNDCWAHNSLMIEMNQSLLAVGSNRILILGTGTDQMPITIPG